MQGWRNVKVSAVYLSLFSAGAGLSAQTNAEVNAGVQFNFSTPGARSLGLGGAFLGLADDATAAYANPAGLTSLSRPEVSFEARRWRFTDVFTDSGRLAGAPTGIGTDSVGGIQEGRAEKDRNGASFLSLVYPKGKWEIAVYRHELANFAAAFSTQGAFVQGDQSSATRLRPTLDSLDLKIVSFGLAAAVQASEKLSLGAGLSWYEFDLDSRTDRFDFFSASSAPGGRFGPPDYRSDNLFDSQIQTGSDRKIGFNAGFLWSLGSLWKIGGVYRQGPKFDLDAIYQPGRRSPGSSQPASRRAVFDTPDVYGLGLAFQPTEVNTILLDVVHVSYSDLTRSFTDIFPGTPSCPGAACRFSIKDSDEIHLGFEHNFPLSESLVAARLGAWYDPDHRIRYTGDVPSFQALFRRGSDEVHYAAGVGYIGSRFQVDAAVDLSKRADTASLSTVVHF